MSATTKKKTRKDGQEATATVEMAILLPVYMLMFVGVLTIGHLVLIRQKIVEAVRFQAWLPDDTKTSNNAQITDNFFATFQTFSNGAGYTQLNKTRNPWRFNDQGIYQGCYDGTNPSAAAKQLAIDVLNDNPTNGGTRQHLEHSHVEGKFTYKPEWMMTFINASITEPKSMCSVLIRTTYQQGQTAAERKVLRFDGATHPWEVRDHDPIEDYLYPRGAGTPNPGFVISIEYQGSHDRFYTPGAPDDTLDEQGMSYQAPSGGIPDTGAPDPGIWNTGYRLGGSVGSERQIFRQMLGY